MIHELGRRLKKSGNRSAGGSGAAFCCMRTAWHGLRPVRDELRRRVGRSSGLPFTHAIGHNRLSSSTLLNRSQPQSGRSILIGQVLTRRMVLRSRIFETCGPWYVRGWSGDPRRGGRGSRNGHAHLGFRSSQRVPSHWISTLHRSLVRLITSGSIVPPPTWPPGASLPGLIRRRGLGDLRFRLRLPLRGNHRVSRPAVRSVPGFGRGRTISGEVYGSNPSSWSPELFAQLIESRTVEQSSPKRLCSTCGSNLILIALEKSSLRGHPDSGRTLKDDRSRTTPPRTLQSGALILRVNLSVDIDPLTRKEGLVMMSTRSSGLLESRLDIHLKDRLTSGFSDLMAPGKGSSNRVVLNRISR